MNYDILHDRTRDFSDINAPDYIPPYKHHIYKSIYEGIIAEIQIVDHCNLNCAFCNHFSPIAEPWCMPIEDFRAQIEAVRDNLPNLKTLILLGGEPTLHPQLLDICKIARELLPEVGLEIFTNGVKIKYIEDLMPALKELNVYMSFSSYPGHYNMERTDKLMQKYDNSGYTNTRIFMEQNIVDEKHEGDFEFNYFNCGHHTIPCFTIKDFKLYICPFAAHVSHYFKAAVISHPETLDDYLYIPDIKGDLDKIQDFIFTAKPICAYCRHETSVAIWQLSNKDLTEYNSTLMDLYYSDYPRYEKILNSGKEYFFKCFDEDKNHAVIRPQDCGGMVEKTFSRYGLGKMDIIIPYYNVPSKFMQRLYNSLINQTIIKDCVIYLISDHADNEKEMIDLFRSNAKLNCVFLKTDKRGGPGVARNKGLDNSYNDYILMLDADDYFIDNWALELFYKGMNGKMAVPFQMKQDDKNRTLTHKGNLVFNRKLLEKNNLRFKPIFIAEDYIFMNRLYLNIKDEEKYMDEYLNNVAVYGLKDNTSNLTSTCASTDYKMEFAALASRYLLYKDLIEIDKNYGLYSEIIDNINEDYKCARSSEIKAIAYTFLAEIYQTHSYLFIEGKIDSAILLNLYTDNHSLTIKNKILQSKQEIKNYAIESLKNIYCNFYLFKPTAELILAHWGEEL